MQTLTTNKLSEQQLDELDGLARSSASVEIRDLLLSLTRCVRDGDEVVAIDDHETLTPSQVAQHLGMSRTHLYKLLDRGAIRSHRIGRDRRIRMKDLAMFELQHQSDRRELAERFAHQRDTAAAADSEIAELL